MKKFILVVFLLLTVIGYAQTTHYANQVTITWDAPTNYENGDPLPIDLDIVYDVYIREKGGEQIKQGEGLSEPPFTITFPQPNRKYDIGIIAKYQLDDTWFYSAMNWSDVNGLQTPSPFEASNYADPVAVEGFRHQ